MSIQTELTRITNAKAAIKTAIEGKGITVPAGTLLDGMASLIESIEAGGGGGNQSPLKIGHKSIIGAKNGIASIDFLDAGITKPYLLYAKLADNLEAVDDYCILEYLAIKKAGTYGIYAAEDAAFMWKTSKDSGSVTINAPSSSAVSSVFNAVDAMGAKPLTVKDGIVYIYFEVSPRFTRIHYGHEYDVYLIGY